MAAKFSATVMVLGVISRKDDTMPPFFFKDSLRMNVDAYLNVMDAMVKPWMKGIAGYCHYVPQQDGARVYRSKRTQVWLQKNLKEFWSKTIKSSSWPHCNPRHCFLWRVFERKVNKYLYYPKASLKAKISEVMDSLDKTMVASVCWQFYSRIRRVVGADGAFI